MSRGMKSMNSRPPASRAKASSTRPMRAWRRNPSRSTSRARLVILRMADTVVSCDQGEEGGLDVRGVLGGE